MRNEELRGSFASEHYKLRLSVVVCEAVGDAFMRPASSQRSSCDAKRTSLKPERYGFAFNSLNSEAYN